MRLYEHSIVSPILVTAALMNDNHHSYRRWTSTFFLLRHSEILQFHISFLFRFGHPKFFAWSENWVKGVRNFTQSNVLQPMRAYHFVTPHLIVTTLDYNKMMETIRWITEGIFWSFSSIEAHARGKKWSDHSICSLST